MLIGQIGYGLAASAFALLALLATSSWRGRLQGGLLVAAATASAAWAASAALADADAGIVHWRTVALVEVLRNTFWLVFIARLTPAGQGIDGLQRHLASFVPAAFVLAYGVAGAVVAGGADGMPMLVRTLVYTGLVTAIAGLVLLEQVYRPLRRDARKRMLPMVVGLGALLAYDLFLYSHGLLFRAIHGDLWAARGYANLLAVPLLLLAARRNPDWSVDVFVSRHVAFYTTGMIGVGAYLTVMAVAGYGLRMAGGEWGRIFQAVFLFGALVLLAWIVFSPGARAALKVFLAKHFYSNKYDYREEWLRLTRNLTEGDHSEPLPLRGLGAMVELAGAKGGALWTIDSAREGSEYRNAAATGTLAGLADANPSSRHAMPRTLANDDSLIAFLTERRWTVNLTDALGNPEAHPGLKVPAWLERLGHKTLVVPLLNQDRLWGVVVLTGPRHIGRLSDEDIDLYRVAGMQVAAVLAQAEADRLLSEGRQFEAYNRFAAFIMHDLKNVIAQQSLVVRNAARYRDNPAFIDDALDTVANSVERMQRLLDQLRRGQGGAPVERVSIARLIEETVQRHTNRDPPPRASCEDDALRLRIDRERLGAVLGHLVTNAQDATPANGKVHIEAVLEEDWLVLAVEDDGAGMEESFVRERLFRPFDSTKGSKGMGIGAYQARQFVESAGGEVRVHSAPGKGTRFELRFPAKLVDGHGDRVPEGEDASG